MTDAVAANGPESTWRGAATKKGKANLTTKGHEKHEVSVDQIISERFGLVRFVVKLKPASMVN